MNYSEAMEFLQNLTKFGFNFGLGRIEELMRRVGDSHLKLKVIHVGGTNGKGSTVAMISSIMQSAGYRVGVFTSPHLHSYTERYRINGKEISESRVAEYITYFRPYLEKMVEEGFEHPTEFEVSTALAFKYFADEEVDFLVLEVGLGGAIDSTNIVNPLLSILTNVAMDHMDYLGNSIREIATVKSGIIKAGKPSITASQHKEALEVIRSRAREVGSELREIFGECRWEIRETSLQGQVFDLDTGRRTYEKLKINLLGRHQVTNGVTAVVAVEVLEDLGIKIGLAAIEAGLATVQWPGRLEIMRREPMVIIDGAHNLDGAQSLRASLETVFEYDNLILVLGMLGDKEREKVVAELAPLASMMIITKPNSPRAGDWEQMAHEVKKFMDNVIVIDDICGAVKQALEKAGARDLVCITGSLYMVAEARECLLK